MALNQQQGVTSAQLLAAAWSLLCSVESLALAGVVCLQWSLLVEGIHLPISLIYSMLQDSCAGESVLRAWGEKFSAFKVSVVS